MHESSDILPIVYRSLRKLAESRLSREAPGHTLTPTELVHEAYLRLTVPGKENVWDSEAHFFGAAALAMRRILVDAARKKLVRRKAGVLPKFSMDEAEFTIAMTDKSAGVMLDVDACLTEFASSFPEEAELVELRFFAGLTMEEAAQALGISRRTAQRRWAFAKAQMHRLMEADDDDGAGGSACTRADRSDSL